jgi:hypothetical protein
MATSRVHTPPRLSSTPELIPAAGQWTRCRAFSALCASFRDVLSRAPRLLQAACRSDHRHSYPCTMGHTWYAQGGDVTARRQQLGSRVTEDEVRFRTKQEARALPCVQFASGPLTCTLSHRSANSVSRARAPWTRTPGATKTARPPAPRQAFGRQSSARHRRPLGRGARPPCTSLRVETSWRGIGITSAKLCETRAEHRGHSFSTSLCRAPPVFQPGPARAT